ncbi:hypothetical protein HYR99_27475 [Candidatus Poribacteria bacterium]|nr:hypothetical protein [Candidatus Poribacteria bacterium]
MSERSEFELLMEIAKLLKKYGPDTFEKLASVLSSRDFSEHLASVLSSLAKESRSAQRRKTSLADSTRAPRDFRSSLIQMKESEPDKSALLLKLYDDLTAKAVLPTLRDIHAFASDAGLPPIKANSRNKAIVPLLKMLMVLPLDELQLKLSAIESASMRDDRSLEGWSNIILDKERRMRSEQ